MQAKLKNLLPFFLLSILCAPVGDYGHVSSGATTYGWNQGPHVFLSPLWFVLVVGVFSCFLAEVSRILRGKCRRLDAVPAPQTLKQAFLGLVGMLGIYFTTSLLPGVHPLLEGFLVLTMALFLWALVDFSMPGLLTSLLASFLGAIGEMLLIKMSAFHYNEKIGILFGVAPWLPSIHFSFGTAIFVLEAHFARKTPIVQRAP